MVTALGLAAIGFGAALIWSGVTNQSIAAELRAMLGLSAGGAARTGPAPGAGVRAPDAGGTGFDRGIWNQ